jgi:hypothetical protein
MRASAQKCTTKAVINGSENFVVKRNKEDGTTRIYGTYV